MKMSRFTGFCIALITALVNWLIFYVFAVKLGSPVAGFLSTIIIISIVVHEIGHLILLEMNGVKTHLIFLVLIGGAMPDKEYIQKYKSLSWNALASIYMAGVTCNLLMVIAAAFLQAAGKISMGELGQITNLNAILIFSNLIPLWIFDGGRFAKVLFDSVSEDRDMRFVLWIAATVGALLFLLTFVTKRNFFIAFWLIFWGLHFKANHDDPEGSFSRLAMTKVEQRFWAVYYSLLMVISATLMAVTKYWYIDR